ncbi:S8 family peptidase [Bacillus sp. SG-1]|uniref:S8 family peptidase n=1 Tax=Bacillus sp. SG-1 TaxID=161544 RepID=UPI000154422D|nr:S8 family peptidase [Bacillus sp. SG-1]EDL65410.1 intracellular alkaline serine proteinase [Bacillus sp. SG-1]
MKKFVSSILVSSLLIGSFIAPLPNNNAQATNEISVVEKVNSTKEFIIGVKAGTGNIESVANDVSRLGGTVLKTWGFINSLAVEMVPAKVHMLATNPHVMFINENSEVETAKSKSTSVPDSKLVVNAYNEAVSAEKVWSKGYTGKGVTVAVVDSGIAEGNGSDFSGRIIANQKFADTNQMSDFFGHGTHVAGIIGGDGSQSGGKYVGVAPGVNLVNVKISDDEGRTGEKNLVDSLQWIYENHEKYNIRVVNISNQIATKQSYKESATNAAVQLLWKAGIVVVVSAGNKGGTDCSVCYAPANDPHVITVGAVDDNGTKDLVDDSLKSWSASGTTLDGHSKPEVVAPGSEIVAYMPKGTIRDIRPGNIVDKSYFRMGGTSMSAPVVSGIVALMLQVNPDLTPDQVKWVLKNTTREYAYQPSGTGGMVRADAAVFFDKSQIPQNVSQNYEISPLLNPLADENGSFSNISWANISWANISWANISWANISWANNFEY